MSEANSVAKSDSQSRLQYLIKESKAQNQLWILIDDDGCVMLNSEDEDCVPVWPSKEFAEDWATGDWAHCKAEAISLNKWRSRWTEGLTGDELYVAVFPNELEEGLILSPYEFEDALGKGR
ncbi:DUF2750 domain-containing protein [Agarivorans sp. Toyoura001]|uniref:DUF2750 domain-containing protein n=1 Tax=unclassified Agarivorans TaxID=2636026 RepID=UPI0010E98BEB|nr:DUF2750 domain-containing protein [Agarivorans sp. Toyoura001]GDY27607.1 hypothetical protein AHAT_34970 [Agarivorans sp. Toyoura001]